MKKYYLFIVPAVFLSWWLGAAVVAVAAARREAKEAYLLAFVGGVFADLIGGGLLGLTALYFLLPALIVVLWKKGPF